MPRMLRTPISRPATEVVDQRLRRGLGQLLSGSAQTALRRYCKFYMHVARLGGHQNRKSDGFPGWLTLWRGWTKLESVVTGFTARPVTCGKT